MIFKCPLHLFYILLHCARKCAPLMWISDEAPTPNQRLCTVTNIVPVETVSTRPSHSTGSGTLSVTTWSCWSPEDEPGLMDCPGGSRGTASAVMLNMLYSIPDVESALHCRLPETLVWLIDLCCLLVCLSVCYLIWTLVSFLIVLASCFHLVLFWWCTCPFVFLVLV